MPATSDTAFVELAHAAKAWPFAEARRVLARVDKKGTEPADKPVVFETGYGPSGLPHIGTFGEVARTSMVRHAFGLLSDRPTRLLCFSDDLDGFRKVPTNVPEQEMLAKHLDQPLTSVPDPFGTHDSFAAHNNARLVAFLDRFGFDYEFLSATQCYRSGMFDATLLNLLHVYDDVMKIILPTLGAERQKTYSPFLPVCPRSGKVLQVPMVELKPEAGTVVYEDPDTGKLVETTVTGGNVKCQWKADWAMRWVALGVDYEMAGKDLIDSVTLSSRIAKALGGRPPEGFSYELFLDENGEKISKSRGNGLTIEEWLTYASPESLSLFMFQKPRTAKRLFFDMIPKAVDEYLTFLGKYADAEDKARLENPVWYIHGGAPPKADMPVSFGLLLNLVSASNAEEPDVLWGFIRGLAPDANPKSHPLLDELVGYAIAYFHAFVKPTKVFRAASDQERVALEALSTALAALPIGASASDLQNVVYETGKTNGFADNLRDWFRAIYEVLLGQSQGPRFGSFIELYGVEETRALIAKGLSGDLKSAG